MVFSGKCGVFGLRRKNSVDAVSEQSADIKQHDLTDKVIIRTIEPKDKEAARDLLKAHHASTIYADYAFSDDKFETHAAAIYAYPEHMVCLVAELNGEIVGLVWASAGSYSLSDELILATCQVIAVHPTKLGRLKRVKTFLRLIKGIKTWSDTRGAHQVLVHVTTGTNLETTDRLLRRSGAKCIGGGYVV